MHPLFTPKGNIGYIHKCVKDWLKLSISNAIYLEKAKHHTNRVGSKGLFPLLSSHTTVRAVRHTAVC